MEFINPNQLQKIMRAEGNRTPQDIWHVDSFEDLIARFDDTPPNIDESLLQVPDNLAQRKKIELLRNFCRELSDVFKENFRILLQQYAADKRNVSPEIIAYLEHNDLLVPRFTLVSGEHRRALLDDYKVYWNAPSREGIIVTFQLPKQLARYWWKGGDEYTWNQKALQVSHTVIEWGHFYGALLPQVWKKLQEWNEESDLVFYRLNLVREHDAEKFYYVWEVVSREELTS